MPLTWVRQVNHSQSRIIKGLFRFAGDHDRTDGAAECQLGEDVVLVHAEVGDGSSLDSGADQQTRSIRDRSLGMVEHFAGDKQQREANELGAGRRQ